MNTAMTPLATPSVLPSRRLRDQLENPRASASMPITGLPGAVGIVEGAVRLLAAPEEANQLQSGEVLVTPAATVDWTALFPRVAAVVTDVGTPLSDAAIVARELGIPVVVDCGDATARLRTGDWVRVDGATGMVEVLRFNLT